MSAIGAGDAIHRWHLAADLSATRKQWHTAARIYKRLQVERPDYPVGQSRVREYVSFRKRQLGMTKQEVFIPQSYPPAAEAQIDWYEAYADLGGERVKLQVFTMRSMYSGASFHRAYPRATQQAFLEAHELAFVRFGGVFHTLRYDNLSSAVRGFCAVTAVRRRNASLPSVRTGATPPDSALEARATKRAA